MTELIVIASASRPESERRVREWGAHHVVNHHASLPEQIEACNLPGGVDYVFSTHTDSGNWAQMAAFIAPQGRIGLIDDPPEPLDLRLMKVKSVSIHWEAMFTRPLFGTADISRQHDILNLISERVDAGQIHPTVQENFGSISAANLRRAHAAIETDRVVGKLVLAGF
jgi:NADPH2:quinone reductase